METPRKFTSLNNPLCPNKSILIVKYLAFSFYLFPYLQPLM